MAVHTILWLCYFCQAFSEAAFPHGRRREKWDPRLLSRARTLWENTRASVYRPIVGGEDPRRSGRKRNLSLLELNIPDYSIFVGELTPEVDDFQLYDYFLKRYPSCIDCKIATDLLGYSRGYAFVRFGEQGDQMRALQDCQNAAGLGGKRIRLSIGISKRLKAEFQRYQSYNYNDYYQDYQNYYSQWGYDPYPDYNYSYSSYDNMHHVADTAMGDQIMTPAQFEEPAAAAEINDDLITEDPQLFLDVDEMNKQFMERSEELYDALMNCHWQPLDVTCEIPFAF
ncbi:tRNA selenocysteine 1-associated protein 1 isoform X1 [Alligator sinensis]|uniref:tRNA selenocysteine-associated protein 1 n=1 Tax=Alligator sinensis TaxID=38654 RepID=A0A3Q0GQE3_ALLSI|nr:tRNA selenocysteine 1-associated protein 1 isoform X1 [Alligator sinensis]XP_025062013.1 tRNA selenocysteine 1-associated protein 1 isoform X1 [Alligator sinensis]XP_025062014.1 tRNA selenocysteine 1-associated protein 1 isoform X1 [Alligator sinensis]